MTGSARPLLTRVAAPALVVVLATAAAVGGAASASADAGAITDSASAEAAAPDEVVASAPSVAVAPESSAPVKAETTDGVDVPVVAEEVAPEVRVSTEPTPAAIESAEPVEAVEPVTPLPVVEPSPSTAASDPVAAGSAPDLAPTLVSPPRAVGYQPANLQFSCDDTFGEAASSLSWSGSYQNGTASSLPFTVPVEFYSDGGVMSLDVRCNYSEGSGSWATFEITVVGPSTTTLTAPETMTVGEPVDVEAYIWQNYGEGTRPLPGGTVNFYLGDVLVGTGTVGDNGRAYVTITPTVVGDAQTLRARYAGGDLAGPSTASQDVDVSVAAPTLNVSTSATAVRASQTITLRATVSADDMVVDGLVDFYYYTDYDNDEYEYIAENVPVVNGVAVWTGTLPVGVYELQAYYWDSEIFPEVDTDDGSGQGVETIVVSPDLLAVTIGAPATLTVPVATPGSVTLTLPTDASRPSGVITMWKGEVQIGQVSIPQTGDVTVSLPVLGLGPHVVTFRTAATDALLAGSATTTVTVAGEPVRTSAEPDADLTGSTTQAAPGETVVLVGTDFLPGETVAFYLHSQPILLGTALADSSGRAVLTVALPDSAPLGDHHVIATGGTSARWAQVPLAIGTNTVTPPVTVPVTPPVTVPVTPPVTVPVTPPVTVPVTTSLVIPATTTAAAPSAVTVPRAAVTTVGALAATGLDAGGALMAALSMVLLGGLLARTARLRVNHR